MARIEEKVEDLCKAILKDLGIRNYAKNESINPTLDAALKNAKSKSGGDGQNYPDAKCLLDNRQGRRIPVMIEAKGTRGKLEKLDKDGGIVGVTMYKGEPNYSVIKSYAVNGALHYGLAILEYAEDYPEVIIIGLNGSELDDDGNVRDFECKAYYVSRANDLVPKHIEAMDNDLTLLKASKVEELYNMLDELDLSDEEREAAKLRLEGNLESKIKEIHQSIYDNEKLKPLLGTNDKLYLFCGLIMAGLKAEGIASLDHSSFHGNDDDEDNDGTVVTQRVRSFLRKKNCSDDKINMVLGLLEPVFKNKVLWQALGGESLLKTLYTQVKRDIIPLLESSFHLDFTGKILNSLSDWVRIENDAANDVVLTPRYVTAFMARLARTNMDSLVWDSAMGSAGFLVSAMDIMIRDAKKNIKDEDELKKKIKNIKGQQLLGVEILGNIYILAILNMILMGDGSSRIIKGDSHEIKNRDLDNNEFPATVFLLNPPYSAPGKGFNFVEEALSCMPEKGYACVLIQENAGAGQGGGHTKRILENNRLIASIHMPDKLFSGKSSVQTAIYLFQTGTAHETDYLVKFIDFSSDGYTRQNRKKSSQEVNLRDTDHAAERYAEVEALVLGKKPNTSYYTIENGLYIEDTITLNGDDWTFAQHKKIDTMPTEEDFKRVVANYLSWKVSSLMREESRDDK